MPAFPRFETPCAFVAEMPKATSSPPLFEALSLDKEVASSPPLFEALSLDKELGDKTAGVSPVAGAGLMPGAWPSPAWHWFAHAQVAQAAQAQAAAVAAVAAASAWQQQQQQQQQSPVPSPLRSSPDALPAEVVKLSQLVPPLPGSRFMPTSEKPAAGRRTPKKERKQKPGTTDSPNVREPLSLDAALLRCGDSPTTVGSDTPSTPGRDSEKESASGIPRALETPPRKTGATTTFRADAPEFVPCPRTEISLLPDILAAEKEAPQTPPRGVELALDEYITESKKVELCLAVETSFVTLSRGELLRAREICRTEELPALAARLSTLPLEEVRARSVSTAEPTKLADSAKPSGGDAGAPASPSAPSAAVEPEKPPQQSPPPQTPQTPVPQTPTPPPTTQQPQVQRETSSSAEAKGAGKGGSRSRIRAQAAAARAQETTTETKQTSISGSTSTPKAQSTPAATAAAASRSSGRRRGGQRRGRSGTGASS